VDEVADGRIRPHEVDTELVRPDAGEQSVPGIPAASVPIPVQGVGPVGP
jgi:hypothetical protein